MSTFAAPTTIDAAVAALAAMPDAQLVAGGTDVLSAARASGRPLPQDWVSLHAVAELRGIEGTPLGGARIGAGTPLAAIAASPLMRTSAAAVATAAGLVGAPATRTVATLGGNLANGSPAMDLGAPLLVHDARVEIAGPAGRRSLAVEDLLVGPGETALGAGEILTVVELPAPPGAARSAYVRHAGRAAMEVTVAGAAALVARDDGGAIAQARIALSAVAPTCVRVREAEALLAGVAPDDTSAISAAADAAAELCAPIDDLRAPAGFRRALVAVVVARALREALA